MSAHSDKYKEAGVDIDLAGRLLKDVKGKLANAKRPEVLAPVGGFGGLFQLDLSRYPRPVLVSSVDGVGTKLMVAAMLEKYDTVGYDIVNHCINDIAVQGAEPLYFLDYLGIGKLRSPLYEQVLGGLADACIAQDVALLGGETAEMPGMYGDDFDLVGCIVGVVDRDRMITGEKIQAGYSIVGLGSSGLHTNGYSLARSVLFKTCGYTAETELDELQTSVGLALLEPHRCYWPAIREALAVDLPLHGVAHLTGGGFYDNIPRVMPDTLEARVESRVLPVPPIFDVIQQGGDISAEEMHRVFNMGVGMVWFVPPEAADQAVTIAQQQGFQAAIIGQTAKGAGNVKVRGIDFT